MLYIGYIEKTNKNWSHWLHPRFLEDEMQTERQIEKRLKMEIERLGGRAYKFVSPGMSGVPDRFIALPGGKAFFVELKCPGEKPRPLQQKRAKELRNLGFEVYCLDSIEAVQTFVKAVRT
jgi:hypothetical protein